MNRPRRHIWCEFVPYSTLRGRHLQASLAKRGIQPILAVTPNTLPELARTIASLRDAELRVGIWPMLDDAVGRWPSTHNTDRFVAFASRVVAALHDRGALPDEVALDLEPPIGGMRALMQGQPRLALRRLPRQSSAAPLVRLVDDIRDLGVTTSAAILPLAVGGSARAGRGWQSALGTPIDDIPVDRVSTMAYTTLFQGYSRGIVGRRDALGLLDRYTRATVRRFEARASVSVGCIGVGVLGDEDVYPGPAQLREDVAVAVGAGATDIAAYNLRGMLSRGRVEEWLDALVDEPTAEKRPRLSIRARAIERLTNAVGEALSLRDIASRRRR